MELSSDSLRRGQSPALGTGRGAGHGRQQLLHWPQIPRQQHPISTYLGISSISDNCKDFHCCQGAHSGRSLDRGHARRWHKMPKQIMALLVKPSINPEQFLQWRQSVRKSDTQNLPHQCTARGRDVLEDELEEGHALKSSPGSCGHPHPCSPSSSSPAETEELGRMNSTGRMLSAEESFPPWPKSLKTLI